MDEPSPPPEADEGLDRALWRAGQLLSLLILLAELAWLANHSLDGRPALAVRGWLGRQRADLQHRWRYLTAPVVARREAPFLWWQAMRHAAGEDI